MSNVIPINRRAIIRAKLHEESEAAQTRLGAFDADQDLVGLLQMMCWRIWVLAPPKYEAECLRSLRFIRYELPLTPEALKCLLICLYILDDRYRDSA